MSNVPVVNPYTTINVKMRFNTALMTIMMVLTGLCAGSPVTSGRTLTPYPYGLFWHHDYALPIPQNKRDENAPEVPIEDQKSPSVERYRVTHKVVS